MINNIKQWKIFLALGAALFLAANGIYAEESGKPDLGEEIAQSLTETKDDGYQPAQALLDGKKVRFSGYGGPSLRFSPINNSLGIFTGGRGGMIVNDSLVIGGGGFGLAYPDYDSSGNSLHMGYGGVLFEYIFFPKSIINFSVGTLVGAGSNEYSTFFILEPEINLFVNITRYFKIGVSGSYRYTNGLNSGTLTDENFRGFSGGLIFEFGKF